MTRRVWYEKEREFQNRQGSKRPTPRPVAGQITGPTRGLGSSSSQAVTSLRALMNLLLEGK